MRIGNFSLSLPVKDIHVSKKFYETLGFRVVHGNIEDKWLIMTNDDLNLGLFQDMFKDTIMTFNPGWDQAGQALDPFTDLRDLQAIWQAEGIEIIDPVDEGSRGPGSFFLKDPDGNMILIDQHRE